MNGIRGSTPLTHQMDQDLGMNQDGKDERIDQDLGMNQDGWNLGIDDHQRSRDAAHPPDGPIA